MTLTWDNIGNIDVYGQHAQCGLNIYHTELKVPFDGKKKSLSQHVSFLYFFCLLPFLRKCVMKQFWNSTVLRF